eukprot:1147849-Pelagomonas_calceolata.AAC.6
MLHENALPLWCGCRKSSSSICTTRKAQKRSASDLKLLEQKWVGSCDEGFQCHNPVLGALKGQNRRHKKDYTC